MLRGIGSTEITLIFVVFVLAWIFSLVDALKTPSNDWDAAGENRTLWIVLIVVLGAIGAILYWLMPRAKIKGSTSF